MNAFKILFLACISLLIGQKNFSQDTIYWKPDYKLKWEDFQGKPDGNSEFGALSYCSLQYSLSINDNNLSYKVYCFFNKSISWTKGFDSIGLIHEQGHFDIAELFARKLRKLFKEYRGSSTKIKQDFRVLFDKNNKERAKMDSLYDRETDYSRNKVKQAFWNKKTKVELKKFELFSQKE